MKSTRSLSFRSASRCENALKERCRCRCLGKLHGVKRLAPDATREDYAALPFTDPHFVDLDARQKGQMLIPGTTPKQRPRDKRAPVAVKLRSGETVLVRPPLRDSEKPC